MTYSDLKTQYLEPLGERGLLHTNVSKRHSSKAGENRQEMNGYLYKVTQRGQPRNFKRIQKAKLPTEAVSLLGSNALSLLSVGAGLEQKKLRKAIRMN